MTLGLTLELIVWVMVSGASKQIRGCGFKFFPF